MATLKLSLRILFLILLCIPIVYIQYYIIKNTLTDVIGFEKKKSAKSSNVGSNNYHKNEYLRIAK